MHIDKSVEYYDPEDKGDEFKASMTFDEHQKKKIEEDNEDWDDDEEEDEHSTDLQDV